MKIENLLLETKVKQHGDWRIALDEAMFLSKKFDMTVRVNYCNQYAFTINEETEIEEIKKRQLIIGL